MKRILTPCLLLISMAVTAQHYKFKAFQTAMSTEQTTQISWNDVDILVVVNTEGNKIKTFGKNEGDYDVDYQGNKIDEKGDDHLFYKAIDESGDKCEIEMILFKDQTPPHVATMLVTYSSFQLIFRLKKDE